MRIAQEEVFGPVLAIIPFDDRGGGVRDRQRHRATALAPACGRATSAAPCAWPSALEAGTVWVNTYRALSYTSPFGGYKRSGLGREGGIEAIREYVQTKSVWISTQSNVDNPFIMR